MGFSTNKNQTLVFVYGNDEIGFNGILKDMSSLLKRGTIGNNATNLFEMIENVNRTLWYDFFLRSEFNSFFYSQNEFGKKFCCNSDSPSIYVIDSNEVRLFLSSEEIECFHSLRELQLIINQLAEQDYRYWHERVAA